MQNILFVDHDYLVLTELRTTLEPERTRWNMEFALDGEAAIELCRARAFDLVLADLWMPGMDGVTLLGFISDMQPAAARLLISHHSQAAAERAARAASVAYCVVPKPCKATELVPSIERILTLQDLFCTPALRATVGRIGGLPSLSTTYTALNAAVRDPEASIFRVARIIEQDIAMAAKVLQLVNSGFLGLQQKMNNLQTAVSYIGLETIKNLALATETFTLFKPDPSIPKSFLDNLQRSANRAATVAAALPIGIRDRDSAVVAALLHDVGELVLANSMPDHFTAAQARATKHKCPLFEAEEDLLGISHAELGAYLLGLWGIDHTIVEAVAHHHRPTRIPHSGLDTSAAVYLSTLLVAELDAHPTDLKGDQLRESDRQTLESLNLLTQFPAFREHAVHALNPR